MNCSETVSRGSVVLVLRVRVKMPAMHCEHAVEAELCAKLCIPPI